MRRNVQRLSSTRSEAVLKLPEKSVQAGGTHEENSRPSAPPAAGMHPSLQRAGETRGCERAAAACAASCARTLAPVSASTTQRTARPHLSVQIVGSLQLVLGRHRRPPSMPRPARRRHMLPLCSASQLSGLGCQLLCLKIFMLNQLRATAAMVTGTVSGTSRQ